ncbi:unnamed protein product [Phytomonas sp. EM1]|nr:unnamed protein product [Phytomonas sp. EM1]|eukprot:CCW62182.1 unnamed protein product [Phytomonas sp. isolate EM1]
MSELPLQFIDWWLSKSAAGRQSFLDDPSTSKKVRANIRALEQYCVAHNYQIYFQSTVRPRPFPRHIFRPNPTDILAGNEEEKGTPLAGIPSFLPERALIRMPAIHANRERPLATMAADPDGIQLYIEAVQTRLADYLREQKTLPSSPLYDVEVKIAGLAFLMVEVVLESITAALQREQIPQRLEEAEETRRRRTARSRRRVLPLKSPDEGVPRRVNGIARPIAEDLRTAGSLLGVHALLSNFFAHVEEMEAGKPEETAGEVGGKRPFPFAWRGEGEGRIGYGAWGAVRAAFWERHRALHPRANRGNHAWEVFPTPNAPDVSRGDPREKDFMPPDDVESPHSLFENVCIQERDVRFAIAKVICHDRMRKFLEI